MDENTKKKLLGELIREIRKKYNLSQDKLSSLIDIDPTNLSKIERGKSFPSMETFCNIVEVLKIEPNYFLSFIPFEKNEVNQVDCDLVSIIKVLPDSTKEKLLELVKTMM